MSLLMEDDLVGRADVDQLEAGHSQALRLELNLKRFIIGRVTLMSIG